MCTERGKPNLVTIFKDDIIRLTAEDKKLCSLLRLYNTFKDFEPRVLVQLNEFLPPDLRYVIKLENDRVREIKLPQTLKEHQSSCQDLHMAPEED